MNAKTIIRDAVFTVIGIASAFALVLGAFGVVEDAEGLVYKFILALIGFLGTIASFRNTTYGRRLIEKTW